MGKLKPIDQPETPWRFKCRVCGHWGEIKFSGRFMHDTRETEAACRKMLEPARRPKAKRGKGRKR